MRKYVFCIATLIYIFTFAFGIQATTVLIDPATQESPPAGEILTIGVRIENVTGLFAYEFELLFDNTALKFSTIHEEEFLKTDGTATFPFLTLGWEEGEEGRVVKFQEITPDVVEDISLAGVLKVANTRLGSVKGINGTDRLVTITFEVLDAKASDLELQNVKLAEPDYPGAKSIPTDVIGGAITFVSNAPPTAEAGNDRSTRVGEEVSFDGSTSTDTDGAIISYSWDFGDGNTADRPVVSHIYRSVGSYIVTLTVVDNDGDVDSDTLTVKVLESLPPVKHSPSSPVLALQANYNEANMHGHVYIDIWEGSMAIETGMFLEFQVTMFSGNPNFRGTVDLHTSDGSTLRDSGARDQNNISAHPSADLSEYARDQWYHRRISLDPLAGKTLDGVMIATDSDEHSAGVFRVYVDNIQITDGESIFTAIYIDEEAIPITGETTATGTIFAGAEGMSDYSVSVVGATPVTAAGKLISSWGSIKSGR